MDKVCNEDTITKVNFILSQEIREENKYDSKIKYIFGLLFPESNSKDKTLQRLEKEGQTLLCKFIDLIYILFKMTKTERDQLYRTEMAYIKNNNITKIIEQLEKLLLDIEVTLPNEKVDKICDIILKSFTRKTYRLVEYIDEILVNLSFFNGLNILLKFHIYTKIINEYLNFLGEKINFEETEINIMEEISAEIILDLFKKEKSNDKVLIQSLVILKFESLKDIINKYNIIQISNALENTFIKVTNGIIISRSFYIEKILMIFTEELKSLNSKENKKKGKKRKKNKNKENDNNINIINIEQEKVEQNIEIMTKEEKEQAYKIKENITKISNINKGKEEQLSDKIEIKEENDKIKKKGDNLKAHIKELLLKILNMSDSNKEILNELKEITFNLIDNNSMLEVKLENICKDLKNMQKSISDLLMEKEIHQKKINDLIIEKEKLEEKISNQEKKISNQEKKITNQEKKISNQEDRIEVLEDAYEEFKEVLGKIQTRDFANRFLRSLKPYLIGKDFDMIRKNKQKRADIISDRIKNKFGSFQKTTKMKIIVNLIKKCCNCLDKGNEYAHSIAIEYYEDDIESYKKRKGLKILEPLNIFCFLIGLDISKEYFDDTFNLLKKYFDNDMKSKNNFFLESYFNN